ncbi:MAG: hypothetical protein QOI30_1863 [Mycobacterium sp.]|nr:hypothetical protein [Mycobacterium sp.]
MPDTLQTCLMSGNLRETGLRRKLIAVGNSNASRGCTEEPQRIGKLLDSARTVVVCLSDQWMSVRSKNRRPC